MKKIFTTCSIVARHAVIISALLLLLFTANGQTDTTRRDTTVTDTTSLITDTIPETGTTITVSGKITDETGAGLPAVTVTLKRSLRATTTDENGNFSIVAPPDDTLLITFVGYNLETVPIAGQTEIIVAMTASAGQELEQVVVVGYGTRRRRDVTGAVSSVQGEELARQPVLTPTQAMQGRAPGVQVISSGAPNSQPSVRIRGTGTMLAGAEPLYVVDGVLTNDIRNINNADIVSVDVLKDASAQAIYGLSGGNGVVIITTKQGRTGPPRVSYNGQVGFRQVANQVEMANTPQYIAYQADATPDLAIPPDPANTDWYDAILKTGIQQNHVVSLSGGSEHVKYYLSAGFFADDGIVIDNQFRRYTFRSNNQFNITNNLKLTAQLSLAHARTQDVNLAAAYNNAYRAAPVIPSKIGNRYGNTSAFQNVGNAVLDIENQDNRLLEYRLQGNFGLEWQPVRSLTLRSLINADFNNAHRRQYYFQYNADSVTFLTTGGNQRNDRSTLTLRRDNYFSYTWDNTATFQQNFGDHDLTVLGGFLLNALRSDYITGSVRDVPVDPDLWYLDAGDPNTETNENLASRYNRISYVARVNYGFMQKYQFTASLRYDGTSRFAKDNRWLASPAVGASWDISRENFMANQRIFDFLKLRVSWGRVANENIDPNLFIVTATSNIPYFFDGQPILGTVIQDIKDQDLQWEQLEETDVGIEFAVLGNRLLGEVTYYNKRTEDALVQVTIPAILGDPDQQYVTNAATFRNEGVEIGLTWKDRVGEDFSYTIAANGTFNRNRILDLRQGQPLFSGGVGNQGFVTYSAPGQPIGSFYVLQAIGIFRSQEEIDAYNKDGVPIQPNAQPGDLKYADINDDGIIDVSANSNDKVFAGSYQPKFYYGINLGFTLRNFDFNADFYGNVGSKVYNGKKAFRYDSRDNVEAEYASKRWTPQNTNGSDPRILATNTPASTYFVESGDYLRLNNITLGYTLPESATARIGISSLRVYVTSQNLFTITPYTGFTPADLPGTSASQSSGQSTTVNAATGSALNAGIELNAYPTSRTFGIGVNVTF